jgi:hypothetical protein
MADRFLEVTEQTFCTRDAQQHTSQFAQKLLPFQERDAFLLRWHRRQDFHQALDAVWRQDDSLADSVNEPAQDYFSGGPAPVSLREFLRGDGFLPVWAVVGS